MSIIKSTAVVSIATLISRVLGFIRDVLIASYLGTGALNDAFIAAFKFANLFRNIFGEGALTSAFVPMFTRKLSIEGTKEALHTAALVQSILVVSLIIFSAVIMYNMEYVLTITTPGFINSGYYFEVAVEIGRITFPYLFFISLAAFYGGILHSVGKFMPFAATAIIFNISMILFALYFDHGKTKAHSIAYGVLVAGILEFLWMLFFLKLNNMVVPIRSPILTKDVKDTLNRMGAGLLGSGIAQINAWVDMIIVSFIPGGLSYIYYADRIMQLPLALIVTATSTVLLPSISRHITNNNMLEFRNIKDNALKFSAFFLIPSSLVLYFFAFEIIECLLKRGSFDHESVINTANALKFLALGLPAFALIKLFSTNFYAHGDIKTPVKIASIALLLNILISISLISALRHVAVSIASASSAWFAAIIMIIIARKREYYRFHFSLYRDLSVYFIVSMISIVVIFVNFNILELHILISFFMSGIFYIAACSIISTLRNKKLSIF